MKPAKKRKTISKTFLNSNFKKLHEHNDWKQTIKQIKTIDFTL